MATLNSAGVGSGLDVNAIVTQLMSAERQPVTAVQKQQTETQSQISAFGQVQSALSSLMTAVNNLKSEDRFSAYKSVVQEGAGFSATPGYRAVGGTYNIEVQNLAEAQKNMTAINATSLDDDVAGAGGKLSIKVGSGTAVDVTIPANANLKDIRDAINQANAGVNASITQNTDASGNTIYNLVVAGKTAGTANQFSLTASGDALLDKFTAGQAATPQVLTSSFTANFSNTPVIGNTGGTLTFASGSGSMAVTIPPNASLDDIAQAINDDPSNIGITAAVTGNAGSYTLQFSANSPGLNSEFSVSASGAAGLSNFTYTPGSGGSMTLTTEARDAVSAMTSITTAKDAKVLIDGVTYTSATNTLTGAIQDVSLNLTKAQTGTAYKLEVKTDADTVTSNIESFVKSYNDLNSKLRSLTAYNTETKTGGALNNDFTARSIQYGLRNTFQNALTSDSGRLNRLSDVGITFAKDGSLTIDSTKLKAALDDPSKDVSSLFMTKNGVDGYAVKLAQYIDTVNGTTGVLTNKVNNLNNRIKLFDKQVEALETRLKLTEQRYRDQFTQLDVTMSKMTQLSGYLTNQLAKL